MASIMTRRNHNFLQICFLAGFFVHMMAFNSTRSSAYELNDREKRALSEEEVGLRGKTITHMHSGKEQVFTTSFKDLDTFAELSEDPKRGLSSSFYRGVHMKLFQSWNYSTSGNHCG